MRCGRVLALDIPAKARRILGEKRRDFVRFVKVCHVAGTVAKVEAPACARDGRRLKPIRICAPEVVGRRLARERIG